MQRKLKLKRILGLLNISIFAATFGEMAEWSNALVLKTSVQQCTGGSNPSLSAKEKPNIVLGFFYFSCDRDRIRTCDRLLRRQMLYPAELRDHNTCPSNHLKKYLSGWQDSNLRPPRPKRGAITGLRYTPKMIANIGLL